MSLYLGDNLISGGSTTVDKSERIGQIIPSTIPLSDAGLHLLDGALIRGSGSYSAFVDYIASIYDASASYFTDETTWQNAVAQYGVCGKFVYDSVNNTVRLPKITGIVEGTTDLTALGDLVEAGLPNITGQTGGARGDTTYKTGVFNGTGENYAMSVSSISASFTALDFDASRSSSIYGNSSTVQPQAIKVLYYIVIATSTKTDIEVDIDEIVTDLNGKADVDLTNINNSCKPIDGQWVNSALAITSSTTAIGTYTFSLSSYLPNDAYNYEVMFHLYGNASGNSVAAVYTDIFPITTSTSYAQLAMTSTVSRNTSDFVLPVGSGREVSLEISGAAFSNLYFRAYGYRRIGTNQ